MLEIFCRIINLIGINCVVNKYKATKFVDCDITDCK